MKVRSKILAILMILALCFANGFAQIAYAVDRETETGSLTINKRARVQGSEDDETGTPLEGVTFRIYKVENLNENKVTSPETASIDDYNSWDWTTDDNNSDEKARGLYAAELKTGPDGQVKFNNLPLGRYLVKEVNAPANVTAKISDFLIDIPYTTTNGTDFNYNPVVTPKNDIIYGGITLNKYGDNDKGSTLSGVEFELQQEKPEGTWTKVTGSGVPEPLQTDANGQIQVDGLDLGHYRFVEKGLGEGNDGYILDNKTTYDFNVTADGGAITVSPNKIDVIDLKPTITKTIDNIEVNASAEHAKKGESVNESANIGDTITYKVAVDIPSNAIENLEKYDISDTMDSNITFVEDGFEVKAFQKNEGAGDTETVLQSPEDYTLSQDTDPTWKITFTAAGKSKLKGKYKIEVTYKATLSDSAKEDIKKEGYKNNAKLTYSDKVQSDYNNSPNEDVTEKETTSEDVIIKTGGFNILKKANSEDDGTPLQGAKFKIAASREDAIAGNFIKDANGDDIEVTSGADGKASYYGLAFGTYWIVETEAPKFSDGTDGRPGTEDDVYYNLLREPTSITIDENSNDSGKETTIINKAGTTLPETGGKGTLIFTVGGAILIIIGVVLLRKRDKKQEEK